MKFSRAEADHEYHIGEHVHIGSETQMMCAIITEITDDGFRAEQNHDDNSDCPVHLGWKAMQAGLAWQWEGLQ